MASSRFDRSERAAIRFLPLFDLEGRKKSVHPTFLSSVKGVYVNIATLTLHSHVRRFANGLFILCIAMFDLEFKKVNLKSEMSFSCAAGSRKSIYMLPALFFRVKFRVNRASGLKIPSPREFERIFIAPCSTRAFKI